LFLKHTHLPIEFHTHCNTGLGPLCAIEAIKAGVRIINTAMPPLSNGSSNPSVLNVLENARSLGYTTDLDLSRVGRIGEGLFAYAKSKGLSVGAPLEYRESHFTHQVPGGMISNLRHQLSQMNMIDRLDAVLDEIVQVRKDFGYPIMVTPYSQFVGVQATLNVMSGQRYKELSDQTIQYAIGLWGETESQAFDANVKDMIFSSSKAKKLINWTPPELSLGEIREKFGGPSVSDDELILRYLGGNEQFESLSKAPAQPSLGFGRSSSASNSSVATLKERSLGKAEVLSLVHALSQKGDLGKVSITSSDMNLYLSH
jgi:oxaloacetate decarboxylase alpha subunit